MSHIWMSHVTHTYEWVTSHMTQTHGNESCHKYEWVTSHTHMNESRHTWHRHMAMSHVWRDSCIWLRTVCNPSTHREQVMSHIWMGQVARINKLRLTQRWMRHVTHVTESYHTREWVMSHMWMSHVAHGWHTSIQKKTCHITRVNGSCQLHAKVMSHTPAWRSHVTHTWMSHATHMNESGRTQRANVVFHEFEPHM